MIKKLLLFLLDCYQNFSSLFPQVCRFYPSCSVYTREAILKKGVLKGSVLGILRILRCHPFHPGGYDPLEKEG